MSLLLPVDVNALDWIALPRLVLEPRWFDLGPDAAVLFDLSRTELVTPEGVEGLARQLYYGPAYLRIGFPDVFAALQARFGCRLSHLSGLDYLLRP